MANSQVVLQNGIIEATVRLPHGKQDSQRFDAAGVVEQVVLHKKHRFLQVENPNPPAGGGGTTYGIGLCSEFMTTGIGRQAAPGEKFPKFGVGLLTQREEGGDFDMIALYRGKLYEVEPFQTDYTVYENRVEFVQHPKPCLGYAARILKTVEINANTLTITTTVENVGEKALELTEYNHNFVAIDGLPIGPGYRLEVPFDGTISAISGCGQRRDASQAPDPELLRAEGQTIIFAKSMEGGTYKKETFADDIKTLPFYRWTLSHTESDARVHETCHFTPAHLVLWGVAHTVCTEAYARFSVAPGKSHTFARTWCFEDAETGYLGNTK